MSTMLVSRPFFGARTTVKVLIFLGALSLLVPNLAKAVDSVTGTIDISASVPPKPTSISHSIKSDRTTTLQQNEVITYTITYSSQNTAAVPVTIQAKWDQGTVEGASEPTVETVSYVIGSASNGYSGSTPVVNLQNKTITWTITSLPSTAQNQTVSFQLRTTANYTGPYQVSFPVIARVTSPTGVPDKTTTTQYRYSAPAQDTTSSSTSPTPSPTPVTQTTTDDQEVASTLPADNVDAVQITGIGIQAVGATSAKLSIQLSNSGEITVLYGSGPNSLSAYGVIVQKDQTKYTIALPGLAPSSTYYFRVVANAPTSNNQLSSDIFSFTTADKQPQAANAPTAVTFSQNRATLLSQELGDTTSTTATPVIIAQNTVVDVNINVPNVQEVKSVTAGIRVPGVLGTSTDSAPPVSDDFSSVNSSLVRISQNMYAGKLRTPDRPGAYEVVGWVEDIHGNFNEFPLGSLRVVAPFTVLDEETQKPIEHAQVVLALYNFQTKLYETISNVGFIDNPAYTDTHGSIPGNLFPGKYQAEVTMVGYRPQTVMFEISAENNQLPTVYLQRSTTLLGGRVEYLAGAFVHYAHQQIEFFQELAQSPTFLNILTVAMSILLLFFVFVLMVLRHFPSINPDTIPHDSPFSSPLALIIWVQFFCRQTLRFFIEVVVVCNFFFALFFFPLMERFRAIQMVAQSSLLLAIWMSLFIALKQRSEKSIIERTLAKKSRSQSS